MNVQCLHEELTFSASKAIHQNERRVAQANSQLDSIDEMSFYAAIDGSVDWRHTKAVTMTMPPEIGSPAKIITIRGMEYHKRKQSFCRLFESLSNRIRLARTSAGAVKAQA